MSERHKAEMIRASAEPAPQRFSKIKEIVSDENMYGSSEIEKFGFSVDKTPLAAEGVVLEAPTIVDGNNTQIKITNSEWKTPKVFKPCTQGRRRLQWMSVFIHNRQNRIEKREYEDVFLPSLVEVGRKVSLFNLIFSLKQLMYKMRKNQQRFF